ncbi:MAG TPA: helix-turn-helix transcriptional regulator [Blastocatellia bacterium]|nr:helix-turn-helix transcriptional regulator [Blastocatellia bacterium]
MSFGNTLQRIRRSKEMTQREVAKKIGMDYSYFSRLENDRFDSKPTRETIDKIAEALECSEEERGELLAEAGRINQELEEVARIASKRPELGQLFQAAVKLPPEKIDEILKQVHSEVEAERSSKQRRK